jgi:hypothetical protein
VGLRSFISGLFSRRSKYDAYAKFAEDYVRLGREDTTRKLTDLGLLPATRLSPAEPVIKLGGEYIGGPDWTPKVNTPSANLLANLDALPPAPAPLPTAQEPAWVAPESRNDDIQKAFQKFHHENPHVYSKLVDLAFAAKASGFNQLAIATLFERLRWYYTIEAKVKGKYSLNNNYRSRYARLIMSDYPALNDFFQIRELY